jgi:hypothetical protein
MAFNQQWIFQIVSLPFSSDCDQFKPIAFHTIEAQRIRGKRRSALPTSSLTLCPVESEHGGATFSWAIASRKSTQDILPMH